MGWKAIGRDGTGWNGHEWDVMGWDRMESDLGAMGQDGMDRNGM